MAFGAAASILPAPCAPDNGSDPSALTTYRELCNEEKFPEFHARMVPTYERTLRSLNVDVSTPFLMPTGFFDPTAFLPQFGADLKDLPTLPDAIAKIALGPPGIAELLGISLPQFTAQLPQVLASLQPTIPPVPDVPFPEVFDLQLTELEKFQIEMLAAPVNAVLELVPKIPELLVQGLNPLALQQSLCDAINGALSYDSDRKQLQAAAYAVIAEKAVQASAVAVVGLTLGAGGVVSAGVLEALGGPPTLEPEKTAPTASDAEQNDIPRVRVAVGANIPVWAKKLGTGIKPSTYRKIKDIAAKHLQGSLEPAYKGLIALCVMYHETGIDPGAHTKSGFYDSKKSDDPLKDDFDGDPTKGDTVTDALLWGASIGIVGTVSSTITGKQFQDAPLFAVGPNGELVGIQGRQPMSTVKQLDFYDEFLGLVMQHMGPPRINLARGLTYTKSDGNNPYRLENIYDLYGLHIGPGGVNGQTNPQKPGGSGYNLTGHLSVTKSKMHTLAQRAFNMVLQGEHAPAYAAALGLSSIDWTRVIPVGMAPYLTADGLSVVSSKAFPNDLSLWKAQNAADISAFSDKMHERDA